MDQSQMPKLRSTHTKIHVETRSTIVNTYNSGTRHRVQVSSRIVTKFEFEVDANEGKREIILPQETFLPKLLVELGKIFK